VVVLCLAGLTPSISFADDRRFAIDAAFAALDDASPNRLKAVIQRNNLSVDARPAGDNTLLMESARHGKKEFVDWLVSQGADVNASNKYGHTSLMFAAQNGKLDIVRKLIASGVQLNSKNNDGNTALHLAVGRRQDVARLLLDAGASTDTPGQYGRTPLMRAAIHRNVDSIAYLLKRGADVNLVDEDGKTALILAVDINLVQTHQGPVPPSKAVAITLLGANADVTIQDKSGKNAINFARKTLKVLKKSAETREIIQLLSEQLGG
jgi:ankyrin repeat protein